MAATSESRDFLADLVLAAAANDVDEIGSVFQAWEDAGATSPPKETHKYPLLHFTPALDKSLELGSLEAADEFFRRGIPPDLEQFGSGAWVALNRGATEANNWNIKTFDFLISRGWDVNYYWGHHGDIIGQAATKGKRPLVEYLLSKGADPSLNENNGSYSALECAALFGNVETLSLLLEHVPAEEVKCSSALLYSAQVGDTDKIAMLLAAGVEVDGIPDNDRLSEWEKEDKRWGTALHVAAAYGQLSSILYLLERGARKDVKSPAGLTPNEVGAGFGHGEAAELLSF